MAFSDRANAVRRLPDGLIDRAAQLEPFEWYARMRAGSPVHYGVVNPPEPRLSVFAKQRSSPGQGVSRATESHSTSSVVSDPTSAKHIRLRTLPAKRTSSARSRGAKA
jgi:hypothetical protein